MDPIVASVMYGYMEIGTQAALAAPDRDLGSARSFVTVTDNVARVQLGTHTGDIELEILAHETALPEVGPSADGSAQGEVVINLTSPELFANTFWGFVQGPAIILPSSWAATRLRVTSPRYDEADWAARNQEDPLDPVERIVLEFASSDPL